MLVRVNGLGFGQLGLHPVSLLTRCASLSELACVSLSDSASVPKTRVVLLGNRLNPSPALRGKIEAVRGEFLHAFSQPAHLLLLLCTAPSSCKLGSEPHLPDSEEPRVWKQELEYVIVLAAWIPLLQKGEHSPCQAEMAWILGYLSSLLTAVESPEQRGLKRSVCVECACMSLKQRRCNS